MGRFLLQELIVFRPISKSPPFARGFITVFTKPHNLAVS